MSDLVARAVITGDAKGLVGAAETGTKALGDLEAGAARLNTTGVAAARGTGALATETGNLAEQGEVAAVNVRRLETAIGQASIAAGVGVYNVRALLDGFKIFPTLARAIGPVGIAAIAAAAGIGILAAAEDAFESSVRQVEVAVEAQGATLQLTERQYEGLTSQIAEVANVSERSARAIAAAFVNAHISPDLWNEAAAAARGYAVATGTDVAAAAQELAQDLDAPAQSMATLDEKYHLLDASQIQLISRLQAQGKEEEAQKVLADALIDRFGTLASKTDAWADAFGYLSKRASNFWDSLGGGIRQGFDDFVNGITGYGQGIGDLPMAFTNSPDTSGPPPGPAKSNADSEWLQQMSSQYDTFRTQMADMSAERERLNELIKGGTLDAHDLALAQNDLSAVNLKIAQTEKAHNDALLSLNETEKQHLEHIKELLANAPQVLQQAAMEAQSARAQAAAIGTSTLAQQQLTDKLAIQKATLPYVTAETYAHGVALQKLKDIVDALTKSMQDQQAADHSKDSIADVLAQLRSFSTEGLPANLSDPLRSAQLQLGKQDIEQWATTTTNNLQAVDGDWQKYGSDVTLLFNAKLAALYNSDLARRTDWSAGIERGLNTLTEQQQNWANTSEQMLTDGDQQWLTLFQSISSNGQDVLGNFFTWWEQQLEKMAYMKYLQGPLDQMDSSILNIAGQVFGLTGGGGSAASPFFGMHTGGIVGGTAAPSFYVPPWVFDGAPSYHGGGRVGGLKPGDRPIIAKDGEMVLTEEQQDDWAAAASRPIILQMPRGMGGTPKVEIHNYPAPGTKITSKQTTQPNGDLRIENMVEQLEASMAGRVVSGQSKVSRALEQTHGIRRTPT